MEDPQQARVPTKIPFHLTAATRGPEGTGEPQR